MRARYVDVDIDGICAIAHDCTGCGQSSRYCCASYEICLSETEVERAIGWMSEAAQYAHHLRSDDGFANVFDETDDGLFSMDTTDSGLCVFAYVKQGNLLCSLHSAALDHGIPLPVIKPSSCLLWPLSISDGSNQTVSVQDDVLDFPCNRRWRKRPLSLYPSVAEILNTVFGERFRKDVEAAASKGSKQARIKLPDGLTFH